MSKPYDRAWRKMRGVILRRDGGVCQLQRKGCTFHATTVDHIIPLVQGGARLDPRNLQAACSWCNTSKASRDRMPVSERWY